MQLFSLTGRRLAALAALLAAIGVGLSVGLLGGAAASDALGPGNAAALPSAHRLASARGALARMKTAPGSTIIAQSRAASIPLYRHPGRRAYKRLGPLEDSSGTHPVFRVLSVRGAWLHVSLPIRPNHSSAWLHVRDVELATTDYRLEVKLRAHRLLLWRGSVRLLSTAIAVGKALTPTPSGVYFLAFVLHNADPSGFYGPYSYGLSAYSNVYTSFGGGDGEIGLHGTSEPWLLGRSASHGCIRVANAVISRLVRLLPLGTPISIER